MVGGIGFQTRGRHSRRVMQTNTATPLTQQIPLDSTIIQQIVIHISTNYFLNEVNGLLLDGWRVVPGTFSCSTNRVLADTRVPQQYVDQDGCCWRQTLFVVLEMDEVNHQNR